MKEWIGESYSLPKEFMNQREMKKINHLNLMTLEVLLKGILTKLPLVILLGDYRIKHK